MKNAKSLSGIIILSIAMLCLFVSPLLAGDIEIRREVVVDDAGNKTITTIEKQQVETPQLAERPLHDEQVMKIVKRYRGEERPRHKNQKNKPPQMQKPTKPPHYGCQSCKHGPDGKNDNPKKINKKQEKKQVKKQVNHSSKKPVMQPAKLDHPKGQHGKMRPNGDSKMQNKNPNWHANMRAPLGPQMRPPRHPQGHPQMHPPMLPPGHPPIPVMHGGPRPTRPPLEDEMIMSTLAMVKKMMKVVMAHSGPAVKNKMLEVATGLYTSALHYRNNDLKSAVNVMQQLARPAKENHKKGAAVRKRIRKLKEDLLVVRKKLAALSSVEEDYEKELKSLEKKIANQQQNGKEVKILNMEVEKVRVEGRQERIRMEIEFLESRLEREMDPKKADKLRIAIFENLKESAKCDEQLRVIGVKQEFQFGKEERRIRNKEEKQVNRLKNRLFNLHEENREVKHRVEFESDQVKHRLQELKYGR